MTAVTALVTLLGAIVERHVDLPKTEDSAETMDASAELLSRLQLWRQQSEFRADADWVFASPVKIGRLPYSYTGVWRELQRAAVAAGVGNLGTQFQAYLPRLAGYVRHSARGAAQGNASR